MNLYESIKKNLNETDSRYYVLRKLQDAFDSLSEIDYGDIEGTDRYGDMKPGLEDQERINKLITDIVQDNNITKEEFDDVAKPYKDGFDISFSYYDYVPKHGKIEEADKGLYVYSNAQSQDGRSDAESYIHNYKAEAPNLDFKVRKDGGMWYVDFIGSKEDIASYLKKLGWYTDKEIEEYGLIEPLNEADDSSNEFKDFLDTKKHTIAELNSLIDAYLKQYPSETGISVASKNPKLPTTKGDYNGWATICIGNHKNSGKVYVFEGKGDGSDDKEMSFEDFCKNYEFRLGREGE